MGLNMNIKQNTRIAQLTAFKTRKAVEGYLMLIDYATEPDDDIRKEKRMEIEKILDVINQTTLTVEQIKYEMEYADWEIDIQE